ncbi:hypothetical protein AB833_10890 [Chromatiales bacterium (ex Bugula neritina AB1)]|nr:hypothetical protein AB833_10890 [Chromatiales bacterium (ex Bugula neritina AB1)]
MKTYDLIVIGGGRASNLAVAAAQAGKKVALIEKSKLGGTCPNRGCVPSKLLIGYAEVARSIRESGRHHIDSTINSINVEQMIRETNEWSSQVDGRYASRHPERLDLYRGHGSFASDYVVEVNGQQLTSLQIVIATGARPRAAPVAGIPAWTSDDLFPLKGDVPNSITIVGGGFIAAEIANFFDAVGIPTTVLVLEDGLVQIEDHDIAEVFTAQFSKYVDTRLGVSIESVEHDGTQFSMKLSNGDSHQSEALFYAIGRVLNTDNIGLENTTMKRDERGGVIRDEYLETSVPGVYAIGDAGTAVQLQHIASREQEFLQRRLLKNDDSPIEYGAIGHAVYSHPEIGSVGLTEQQAEKSGRRYVCVLQDWLASARAMSTRLDYPRTKLIVDVDTYEIIGCHLIGPESSTMIHQIMMLMHLKNDIRELPAMIHIHPALPEALMTAANAAIAKIESQKES